jgi:hypothetical protein
MKSIEQAHEREAQGEAWGRAEQDEAMPPGETRDEISGGLGLPPQSGGQNPCLSHLPLPNLSLPCHLHGGICNDWHAQ